MRKDVDAKLPIKHALLYIALSVVCIWGTLFFALWYHKTSIVKRQNDPRYTIHAIASSTKSPECLSTNQLAELLGLSVDEPLSLYSIDIKSAKNRLLAYPAIKSAHIRRLRPNVLFVDYELRFPEFILDEFENVAIDKEGYPFPLFPVFTPKKIPRLVLGNLYGNLHGNHQVVWNTPIKSMELDRAIQFVDYVQEHFPPSCRLLRLDTRSLQEFVALFEEEGRHYSLRLHPKRYKLALKHFLLLRSHEPNDPTSSEQIVDLRFQGFALCNEPIRSVSGHMLERRFCFD